MTRTGLALPALAVVLSAVGHHDDALYRGFLAEFTGRLGATPLYLALVAAAVFYASALWRRIPGAGASLTAAALALAVVGPGSLDVDGLTTPRPEALLAAAGLVGVSGLGRRSPARCLVAVGLAAGAVLAGPGAFSPRAAVAGHLMLAGLLTVGATFPGRFARAAQTLGVAGLLGASLAVSVGWFDAGPVTLPAVARAYPPILSAVLLAYGFGLRCRPAQAAAAMAGAGWILVAGGRVYNELRQVVTGLDAIVLGLVLLAVAELISLAKAGLLPRRLTRAVPKPPPVTE